MSQSNPASSGTRRKVAKCPTGIHGLDEITGGGLPAGRSTLLCGGAGSGKTLLAMEFIVNGIARFGENGVYLTFEETREELYENGASLGYDLDKRDAARRLFVKEFDLAALDHVEAGRYDLEGLFSQIGYAIERVAARRIVIDGIETLFSYFTRESLIRRELKRLIRWLKEKDVTAVITSESGTAPGSITRHGIEEYVSDCVVVLDHRIENQVATRRLQIKKFRGSCHGTNEYPFLITDSGLSVFPITSMALEHDAPTERVSTGIQALDEMFGGGYYRGSSLLITGTAGTGKSSLAAHFAKELCANGEKCIYFAFEESPRQIIRNMSAIDLDLQPYVDRDLLQIHAARPMLQGLEMHLLTMHDIIRQERPQAVILDPITNLESIGNILDIRLMFTRLMDYLKAGNITGVYTALTPGDGFAETTEVGISSIMDTWVLLQNLQRNDEWERSLYIVKSRGIGHSNKIHTFEMTDSGIAIDLDK